MKAHVDHIYDLIQIDERYLEILEIYEERLSSLKEEIQGIILSHVYPLRSYKCWEHQIGIYHLVNLCEQNNSLETKVVSKNLKLAALLHNIGHANYGYLLEELLMYYDQNEDDSLLMDRYNNIEKYLGCKEKCKLNCLETTVKEKIFQRIKNYEAAKIILSMEDAFKNIKQNDKKRYEGFQIGDIIRYLICKEDNGFKMLNFLDQIDFILRDLYYLGIMDVRINFQYLLDQNKGNVITEIEELKVVQRDLFNYLCENIYSNSQVVLITRLMQKRLIRNESISIDLLKEDEFLKELFNFDNEMSLLQTEAEDFKLVETFRWVQKNDNNLALEEKIIPPDWNFGNYHEEKNLMLVVSDGKKRSKRASLFISQSLDKFTNIIGCLLSMKSCLKGPDFKSERFVTKMLGILFEGKVVIDHSKSEKLLNLMIEKYCDEGNRRSLVELYSSMLFNINKEFMDMEDDSEHSIIKEFDRIFNEDETRDFEKNLDKENFDELISFKRSIFSEFRHLYNAKNGVEFINFLETNFKEIVRDESSEHREKALELLVFIQESKKNMQVDKVDSWIVPSFKIGNEKEFDCMTLEYRNGEVEINIIEVTLTSNEGKTINDLKKNQDIIDRISKKYKDIKIIKKIIAPELKVKFEPVENIIQ
ncbi:hypothetical protein [Tindallia californiensis]|uniref:HD superfamily phosphohydrolase n=1 Tax=Tindallia californiensis TaxID=159292 RepID=A0A1H3QQQ9_9FIRM|nr:hypothetical protein [Tindallia californiensis]SDZ15338.1 HD superfamily phosphohydrolase [Tindallia californiensis]